jgi:hypothetical protein
MRQWLRRMIWGLDDAYVPAPARPVPLPPILRLKLWTHYIENLRKLGYVYPPTILEDVMAAQDAAIAAGQSAYEAAIDALEAGRIDVPFRDVCICGHKHP